MRPFLPLLLAATAGVACGDATGPSAAAVGRLERLIEYPFGGRALRQQGTFQYDAGGRLVRWDYGRFEPEEGGGETFIQTTYFALRYAGDRVLGGELFVFDGARFVKSREWTYGYDPRGRRHRLVTTQLLSSVFDPIHVEFTEGYEFDEADRLIRVNRADGSFLVIAYAPGGDDVLTEALHTTEGNVIEWRFTYDNQSNPFRGVPPYTYVTVMASWATVLSTRNVVAADVRVNGDPAVLSRRTVHINSYSRLAHPVQWLQVIETPDDPATRNVFVAELSYVGGIE